MFALFETCNRIEVEGLCERAARLSNSGQNMYVKSSAGLRFRLPRVMVAQPLLASAVCICSL